MKKLQIFLVGGFGCIAPNIINFASKAISGGAISGNIIGIILGGFLFFIISGFLVLYILDARDIKDAFYKGVAVPTLIISLANGAGVSAEKTNATTIPTVPVNQIGLIHPGGQGNDFLALFKPTTAYADNGRENTASQGSIEFNILPKDIKNISVSIITPDKKVVAQAHSDTSNFKLNYFSGEYTAIVETSSYYKEVKLKIEDNKTTKIDVTLEQKGIIKQFSSGIKSLMMKR